MKAPAFWEHDGPLARLFEPAAALYAAAGAWRMRRVAPWRAPIPVICVGNVVAGGAGKTPVALDLLGRLPGAHALLRGYGGRLAGPLRVRSSAHGYEDVGDEALLLAAHAPTWIARDRAAGARAAADDGATAIVMDDGFQNPSLHKTLSLLVIDGAYGLGNRRVMPAGPLREPFARALARADAAVILGDDGWGVAKRLPPDLPVLHGDLTPGPEAALLAGQKVVAFAGIGRPAKFFATLRGLGARVVASHPFADHYPYAPADIQPILDEAFQIGAVPVTTAKDAVRLPLDQRQQVNVLSVSVAWRNEAVVESLLRRLGGPA